MDRLRVIVTDEDAFVAENLKQCLCDHFEVIVCTDSRQLMETIHIFDPDILLLDLYLPGNDAIELISAIRASGNTMEIVAVSRTYSVYIDELLKRLGVFRLIVKPHSKEVVLSAMCAAARMRGECDKELEIQNVLGSLGFQLGTNRTTCVTEGVLLWYRSDGDFSTKQLYLELAQRDNRTATGVEKAIRDAIHHAWNHSNRSLWKLYFSTYSVDNLHCPSNEVFIARMAQCLRTKEKLRLPYKKAE